VLTYNGRTDGRTVVKFAEMCVGTKRADNGWTDGRTDMIFLSITHHCSREKVVKILQLSSKFVTVEHGSLTI